MDKRELILARLFMVLGAIPGVEQCVRNRAELPDEKRPAILMLDGNEESRDTLPGVPPISPMLVSLEPEIYLSMKSAKPDNVGIGQALNAFRVLILKAITTDAVLLSLIGTNGKIQYNGCITDLARGRAMDGEMALTIAFVYILKPTEL